MFKTLLFMLMLSLWLSPGGYFTLGPIVVQNAAKLVPQFVLIGCAFAWVLLPVNMVTLYIKFNRVTMGIFLINLMVWLGFLGFIHFIHLRQ